MPDKGSDIGEPVLLCVDREAFKSALSTICRPISRNSISDLEAFAHGEGRDVRVVVTIGALPVEETVWTLPNLELIAVVGAGHDGVDVRRAKARQITVANTAGANSEDVADLALGLLIATVRQIAHGDRIVRAGAWRSLPQLPLSPSISKLRCGIVGLGAVGNAVARRLDYGFGADVAWWGPRAKPDVVWPRAASLLELAEQCDALIVAASAGDGSRELIDAEVLAALGPRGYLINVARGSLVDEAALRHALRAGRIAGAGLDVFAEEPDNGAAWADLDRVVLTPHGGGWAERSMSEVVRSCVANVEAFLKGEPLPVSNVVCLGAKA